MALVYEALYALRDTHPPLQARLLAVCARAEAALGRRGPAVALSERAVDLAQGCSEARALLDALMAKRLSLHVPQDAARARDVSSEIVKRAGEMGARPLIFAAYETRIAALLTLGEIAAADRDIAAASEIAARLRAPAYDYAAARLRFGRALGGGELERARPLLGEMLRAGQEAEDPDVASAQRIAEFWLLHAEGRAELGRGTVEALCTQGGTLNPAAHAFAASYWASLGERAHCAEHFEQAAAQDFEDLPIDDDWPWNIATCAEVCAQLQDTRRAGRLHSLLSGYASINVTSSLCGYRGSAEHWLGALALVLGDPRAAWGHFERAIEFNRRIGATTALVLTQHRYGTALQHGTPEERDHGRALLESARKTAEGRRIGVLRHADLAQKI
jgi:tetratricopeptide (TPR) repeat protein